MQLPILFTSERNKQTPMTQLDAFIHFLQLKNLEMINRILELDAYMKLSKSISDAIGSCVLDSANKFRRPTLRNGDHSFQKEKQTIHPRRNRIC